MLKFLRKYQGWIMAVGGGLLMVAFLLPEAISRFGQVSHNPTIATIRFDGSTKEVQDSDWRRVTAQLAVAEAMLGVRDVGPFLGFPPSDRDEPDGPGLKGGDHWYLLVKEAELAGLVGGAADGERVIAELASAISESQRVSFDEAYDAVVKQLSSESGQAGFTLEEGLEALGVWQGVARLTTGYANSVLASDQRVRQIIRDFQHRANISMVFLDAADRIDEAPEPDEQALEEQFEKYRDVVPGEGDHGFGYRLGDRAQVEFLRIDYRELLDTISANYLDARKWYAQNSDQARGADGPTGPPPFENVADDALAAYKRTLAEDKMESIARFIKGELTRPLQDLERDGAYRTLPDDWSEKRVSFEALRDQIQERFGVDVEYTGDTTKWYTMRELGELEGIGRSMRKVGAGNMSFRQLVASHRGFDDVVVPGLQPGVADASMLRSQDFNASQVGEMSYLFDAYVYRVIAVDPARAPETLDEVREDVVQDVKRQMVYEQMVANADSWRERVLESGLDDFAESVEERIIPGGTARYGSTSSRPGDFKPNQIGGITSPTLISAVFDRLNEVDVLTPISEIPEEDRTLVIGVPEELGLAVVRLESQFPVSRQAYTQFINQGLRVNAISREYLDPLTVLYLRNYTDGEFSPFSFASMKDRFDWVEMRKDADEEDGGSMGSGGEAEKDQE